MGMNKNFPDDQLQDGISKNTTERRTIYLDDGAMEKFAYSDDDYRLPRELPQLDMEWHVNGEYDHTSENLPISDEGDNVTDLEKRLLEESAMDLSSDESQNIRLLDHIDEDGNPLNEMADGLSLFDIGDELDMPEEVVNPDSTDE